MGLAVNIHRWWIDVEAADGHFREVLSYNVPDAVYPKLPGTARRGDSLCLRFHAFSRDRFSKALSDQSAYSMPECQIARDISFESGVIDVSTRKEARLPDTWLYHVAFLQPVSFLLRSKGATLVHAGLLSKENSGTLIVAHSGMGKSTLSLILLLGGYTYFSDEHPPLFLEGGVVKGGAFPNHLAIGPLSARQFPQLKARAQWVPTRKKYYVDPRKFGTCGIGQTCRIDRVIFPIFEATATSIKIRAIPPTEVFGRLLQDDYFHLRTTSKLERKCGEAQLTIFQKLALQAMALSVTYGPKHFAEMFATLDSLRTNP